MQNHSVFELPGYKNHIGVDRRHKFVRRYAVSDASVYEKLEDVLDANNAASDVWADSAYRSDEIEEKLAERGLKSRIHRRAYRNRKLSEAQKAANTTRSKVRARVEHVFGGSKERHGSRARAHHWHRPRAVQNRNDEPRLQHAPIRLS
jgi:IS5 family transposase